MSNFAMSLTKRLNDAKVVLKLNSTQKHRERVYTEIVLMCTVVVLYCRYSCGELVVVFYC